MRENVGESERTNLHDVVCNRRLVIVIGMMSPCKRKLLDDEVMCKILNMASLWCFGVVQFYIDRRNIYIYHA